MKWWPNLEQLVGIYGGRDGNQSGARISGANCNVSSNNHCMNRRKWNRAAGTPSIFISAMKEIPLELLSVVRIPYLSYLSQFLKFRIHFCD